LIRSQVSAELLQYYNQVYKAAQYNPNLFALVIERAITIGKNGTFLGFIIPSLWLTNAYFSQFRQVMEENCQIIQLVDLGFGVFEEIVETSLFSAKKRADAVVYETTLASRNSNTQQITLLPVRISSEEISAKVETGFDFFSQKSNFRAKFDRNVEPLSRSFTVYRGVETRDNEKYLASSQLSVEYKPILMGTDVNRYICEWTGTYVKFVPEELKSNAN